MEAHKREAHRQNANYHVFIMASENHNARKMIMIIKLKHQSIDAAALSGCNFRIATDPVLSSVAIIQLQNVALNGVAGRHHHPPGQGGAVVPSAAFLQLQQRRSRHGWS